MSTIKNIMFDLGGVLIDIDITKTEAAFETLGVANFGSLYALHKADKLFDDLETGHASEDEFYNGIRQLTSTNLNDGAIEKAWNALLLDFRVNSLTHLEELANRYNLYLFSNTNIIHYKAFSQLFTAQTGKPLLEDCFTKCYYSFTAGVRKPHTESFLWVLNDAGINAANTLFIDDLAGNIEGAQAAGMQTHHLLTGQYIERLGL
jgi:glucose-1-phosphatase